LNDLWDRWAAHYRSLSIDEKSICRDGIAEPERFAAAPERILFVMREANNWPGGDIRLLLRDGPRYQVWHMIGRWAAGLLRGFPSYESIDNRDVIRDALQRVASINLKKSTGGSSADLAVINAFAWQDRALLREQIERIGPTTIVACGTASELVWLLDVPVNADAPRRVVRMPGLGARVIPWVHPARCDNRKSYQDLASLVVGASRQTSRAES
jgi:hypothetical protein